MRLLKHCLSLLYRGMDVAESIIAANILPQLVPPSPRAVSMGRTGGALRGHGPGACGLLQKVDSPVTLLRTAEALSVI